MAPGGRDLPHSLESEQAVLGAILVDDGAFGQVAAMLRPDDFYLLAHRYVFAAAEELAREAKTIDPISVQQRLDAKGLLGASVPRELPLSLGRAIGTTANVTQYGRTVQDLARLRHMMLTAQRLVEHGYSAGADVARFLADATRDVGEAAEPWSGAAAGGGTLNATEASFGDDLRERRSGTRRACPTGLDALDEKLEGGLRQGLYLLAAPPGAGKTTLALQVGEHVARARRRVLFVALEMPRWDLETRLVAARLGWSWPKVRGAQYLDEREVGEVLAARAELSRECSGLEILETGHNRMTVADIRREVERTAPALVVIDYLQAVAPDPHWQGDRRNAVGTNAYALKTLSTRAKVPILALSSVSRDWYGRGSEKPENPIGFLAAGKESGDAEFAADVVLYLDVDEADARGSADGRIVVAKNRGGERGFVGVRYDGAVGRFHGASTTTRRLTQDPALRGRSDRDGVPLVRV
jgi:replicative DNA helicase